MQATVWRNLAIQIYTDIHSVLNGPQNNEEALELLIIIFLSMPSCPTGKKKKDIFLNTH